MVHALAAVQPPSAVVAEGTVIDKADTKRLVTGGEVVPAPWYPWSLRMSNNRGDKKLPRSMSVIHSQNRVAHWVSAAPEDNDVNV